MSDYILCQVKRASLPFYVENISKNIYCLLYTSDAADD